MYIHKYACALLFVNISAKCTHEKRQREFTYAENFCHSLQNEIDYIKGSVQSTYSETEEKAFLVPAHKSHSSLHLEVQTLK